MEHHLHRLHQQFSFICSLHSFCFCIAWVDKSGDFSLYHFIVCVHPPPTYIYFVSPPCLLIDFKNSKWFITFALLCICYCFSHLIGLFSVTWLFFLYYKFTRFLFILCFSLMKGLHVYAWNIRLRYPFGSTLTFLYFK